LPDELTHEIEDPIGGCTDRSTFRAHGQRVDLCRIQPRYTLKPVSDSLETGSRKTNLHADAEEHVVQKEADNVSSRAKLKLSHKYLQGD
jgi:hypothetical protein